MSFVWRSGVTGNTSPDILSDTGLLAIRIVMTLVLGIGMFYGFLIMTTFRRYGTVMDIAWKQRIDTWLEEKATTYYPSYGSYPEGSRMYQPSTTTYYPSYGSYPESSRIYQPSGGPWPSYGSYPDGSTMHQPSAYNSPYYGPPYPSYGYYPDSSGMYQPSSYSPYYRDAQGGYGDTHVPAYASDPYIRPPEYMSHPVSPHSTPSTDSVTQRNTIFNQSSKLQHDDDITSPGYIPSAGPSRLFEPIASAEDIPPRHHPKKWKPDLVIPPLSPSLPPISETPITPLSYRSSEDEDTLGVSEGQGNRSGADDTESRVRFRSPLISDQESINLGNESTGNSQDFKKTPEWVKYTDRY